LLFTRLYYCCKLNSKSNGKAVICLLPVPSLIRQKAAPASDFLRAAKPASPFKITFILHNFMENVK
jgi:hypothetical protein